MFDWVIAGCVALYVWLGVNGFPPSYILAGFLGSIVRAIVAKTGTIWENLAGGFVGAVFAAYLTPVAVLMLSMPSVPPYAVAFFLGMVGVAITETIIAIGKDYKKNPGKLKEDFRDLALRLIGPKDK
ncbi:hypothetical protein [Rhizobium sp. Root482]|uniref:hypothetical protein n=1 Tax=Rhizobium sp. Root482 TaxID=1736543 RepID=UPI0006F369CC|nr:hypothetical protein [Rhizobium sp. Root482]KQY14421.1 hypothetical protein ASD31_09130 [Rhizobium sp. Root482]